MIELIDIKKNGIIEEANIRIPKNSKVVLLGSNGAGKTTLLYLLSGVYLPDSGVIKMGKGEFNFPLKLVDYRRYFQFLRNNIFFIENTTIFHEKFSIEQNIKYFTSMDEYEMDKIWELYSQFKVNENPSKIFKNISKGTKQKLIAILAIASKKQYLLLDEPTLGLDNESKLLFYKTIKLLNKTIIISTHDIESISDFDLVYNCESNHLVEVKNYENI